jgi:hypothetical protein
MFGTLGGDASDGFPDLSPAGTLCPGGLRRSLAETLSGPTERVCESELGQSCLPPGRYARHDFEAAHLYEVIGE